MDEQKTTTEEHKAKFNPLPLIIIMLILGMVGWMVWLGMDKKVSNSEKTQTAQQFQPSAAAKPTAADNTALANSEVKTVNVEAGSFYYKPNEIQVKKGQKVKIVMHAVSMMHDFNIDELNVHMPIVKNGETGTVEFTTDKAGTFEYYCSVGQHRKMGQVGKLIVE